MSDEVEDEFEEKNRLLEAQMNDDLSYDMYNKVEDVNIIIDLKN